MPLRTGLFVALLAAAPLVAQAQSKEQMIADWTRDKTNVLDYTRAIPDSALGFRATPGVRTLAEQIEHIVQTNEQVAAEALRGAANPKLGDPKVYLKNKAALVKYVTDTYLTQRTSAPSAASVSMSTAVCTVMCSEPMILAPARGRWPWYSARIAMRPGISNSARRISLRPNSAKLRSRTLNGGRPACTAA